MENKKVLLSLDNVKMHFPLKKSLDLVGEKKFVKAVDGVTFDIYENETLGLVGESGCGKTTLGRVILQLYKQTLGDVLYNGVSLSTFSRHELRRLRRELQIVFQDPYSSLNPRMTAGQLISEAVSEHGLYRKGSQELEQYTLSVMERCGLQRHMIHRYPHQFSGGQRQRIGIARAVALAPKFIVCDECVSTLDVSIQSQIINLLLDLKERENLTYLFISHDLSVVRYISDRIGVMYLGNIVELCASEYLFKKPFHPYTKALLRAIPTLNGDCAIGNDELLEGDVPSPIDPPTGCKFHPRCRVAKDVCRQDVPTLKEIEPRHYVACHFPLNGGEDETV